MTGFDIVLTGATGMIGGEVLTRLLDRGARVLCLVRADDSDHAIARVKARLLISGRADLVASRRLIACESASSTAVALRLRRHGNRDCQVLHLGCDTSFKPFSGVFANNVMGFKRMMQFCKLMGARRLCVMSTAAVNVVRDAVDLDEDGSWRGDVSNEYILSKRMIEHLCRRAPCPYMIVRPSVVLSHGIQCRKMARAVLWFVRLMELMTHVPLREEAKIDIIPVGFAAEAVVGLVCRGDIPEQVIHISAGDAQSSTCRAIVDRAALVAPGLRTTRLAGECAQWGSRRTSDSRLSGRVGYYAPFVNANCTYSNEKLARVLNGDAVGLTSCDTYIADLVGQIGLREAIRESRAP